ncbi:metal tolerance protein B [Cynara cardunculus var. scolymus]|nr:metal tolerance protein B [Cynara cardunculus var. scolymus]
MEHQDHQVPISGAEHHLLELEMPKSSGGTNVASKLPCDHCCSFSKQEQSVMDIEQRSKSTAKLCGLVIFYLIVMAVEIVGGLKANSLAVLADAAHLLTDIGGFSISLFTIWASGWNATPHQSFGFGRVEVLGAFLSLQLVWMISGYLIFEAIERLLHKHSQVNGGLMFAIAAFGFVINFIMVIWLGHGHSHSHSHSHEHGHGHSHDTCHEKPHHDDINEEEGRSLVVITSKAKSRTMNINIQGAYLHVMADMIQSVGVMIAGLVIWVKPEWLMVDLVCTLIFSVLALATTLQMLRNIFSIVMESTPSEIDVVCLKTDLNSIKGVHDVHDLHVWAITQGKIVLACHIIIEPSVDSNEILHKVKNLCKGSYGIHHITVQIEQD